MPSEVVQDTALMRITPLSGKGALGKRRALTRITVRTLGRVSGGNLDGCRAGDITCCQGVYAGRCLSLGLHGKVLRGKLLLPTGLGKSDRPG